MTSAHLSRGKLNIGLVQERARKEFLDLLDSHEGTKIIIWDNALSGPFSLISEYALLKKRDAVKMYMLKPGKLKTIESEHVIFITRPQLKLMNCISENIHGEDTSRKRKKWHIFFAPMKSLLCIDFLKNKGVFGSFTSIEEMPGSIIYPFDNDLMSMEIDNAFKDYYIDSDATCLYQSAKALVGLEELFGPIKRVAGKGNGAARVMKLMARLRRETRSSDKPSQIDQLLILDRDVDLLSTLATQLTYEGLIDELFGINNCVLKLPAEKFASSVNELDDSASAEKLIILNSSDEVHSEIRDKQFFSIGQSLSRKAREISSQFDERHDGRTIQEMKQFVAKLPQMLVVKKCLSTHMTIAEMIKEVTDTEEFMESLKNEHDIILGTVTDKVHPYIEDCINRKDDLIKVLRLICIHSVVTSGFKLKVFEQYKRDVIQTYGFQHILTLANLEKAGLLKVQQSTRPFMVLRKTLKLVSEEDNEKDGHFVHGVYAPLSARLAQQAARPSGIRNLNDVISLLPGTLFDQLQSRKSVVTHQRRGSTSSQSDSTNVILIFFISGCTYSEIAALRFISQQEELNVEFVIATTKIINGKSFIKSLMEPLLENPSV